MALYGNGYTMQEVAVSATDFAVGLGKRTYDHPLPSDGGFLPPLALNKVFLSIQGQKLPARLQSHIF